MKVTLTVEADTEDELRPYIDGPTWKAFAWDFDQWLRQKRKHEETEATTFSEIVGEFHQLLGEHGLNLD